MKIISWNVNGIRACYKKGFNEFLAQHSPDLLFLQETKISEADLPDEIKEPFGYQAVWHSAKRKGYSGVAVLAKTSPTNVISGFGQPKFDCEGRVIQAEFGDVLILGVYFPNGQRDDERLQYKLDFYESFFDYCEEMRAAGKQLIICGDFNTAHTPMDLARPKENQTTSGFLPIEREWISELVRRNYVDVFRQQYPNDEVYSWWSYRAMARQNNVGWRIDYFMVDQSLVNKVEDAFILNQVMGSDHCPVGILFKNN